MRKMKAVVLVMLIAVLYTSCSTTRGLTNENGSAIPIERKNVEIVGPVSVRYTAHGILGIIPELSLISWGNYSSYVALSKEADKVGADEVINIKTDLVRSNILVLYTSRTWIATGLAIKYVD
jgi:PBP1b-binding outer membrane lipoprotein LpoB